MKKQYTEMVTNIRKAHKTSGLSYEELQERGLKIIANDGQDDPELRVIALGMETLYEMGEGICHIFLPGRSFCDWLADCARTLDAELGTKAGEGFGSSQVCLHFPCESRLPAALVKIGAGEDRCALVIDFSLSSEAGAAVVCTWMNGQSADQEMHAQYPSDETVGIDTRKHQAYLGEFYTRMIAGLGLYMTCFPEQVKDGIPSDAKRADYARGNAKTIGVSDKVIQRDGPTPHYRSGHFRLLSADRYVNKRGQVVFVHGCFVKGQAKTVLSPESEVEA